MNGVTGRDTPPVGLDFERPGLDGTTLIKDQRSAGDRAERVVFRTP